VGEITAAVVGGVAVVSPATFVAAPAIGGAIGATFITGASGAALSGAAATSAGLAAIGGGSLAVGGLGMAGGIAILTGVGAALGGTLGGVVANSYIGAIEGFKIQKVRSGRGPAVLFINGFLSQGENEFGEWEEGLEKFYPNNPWYLVKWESKRLRDIGKMIGATSGSQILRKSLEEAATRAAKEAAKKGNILLNLYNLYLLSKNPWHTAMVRAAPTGALLAEILSRVKRGKFILLGNSLGARVVFYALSALGTQERKRVQMAHIMGGAVGSDDREAWKLAIRATEHGVRSYYSQNDNILNYLYRIGTFFRSNPIGRELCAHLCQNCGISISLST